MTWANPTTDHPYSRASVSLASDGKLGFSARGHFDFFLVPDWSDRWILAQATIENTLCNVTLSAAV